MKNKNLVIFALSGFILAGIAIAATRPSAPRDATPQAEASQAEASKAETLTLPPGMFQATKSEWESLRFAPVRQKPLHTSIKTDGKIATDDDLTTPVFSPYSGRVIKLFAKAGDKVERGDPLMAIAAPDFTNARAQLKLATLNEQRQHALYEAKTAAKKDWLQAQADLETAKGNFRAADIEQDALRRRLHKLGKNEAEITRLQSDAIVTAPITGIVTQRQVGLGQYINSASGNASNPAFSIGDVSKVWLLANVAEGDAPFIHTGERVEVAVHPYPDRKFTARLIYVAPSFDPVSHRLPVRAEIDNADGALKPEMFASFSIVTDHDAPALEIPADAIIYEGPEAHVWMAEPSHKWLGLKPVRVGRSDGERVEIVSGLKPGETVVTSGSLFIDRAAKGDAQDAHEATGNAE